MRPHSHERLCAPRAQQGAALVIGLILLLVLTLLAVAGMNTANTELVMAGNEQYRQNAFQAADTGIEQALTVLPTIPQDSANHVVPATNVPGSTTGDQYTTSTRYLGSNQNLSNFSTGKFIGFYYNITSTGTSTRNASARHTQGAYVVQTTGGSGSYGSIN